MKATVKDNEIIHIGEWCFEEPLPAGAVEGEFDLVKTSDGLYVFSSDYTKLRCSEYPPITDYLDGIVKGDKEQVAKYISECLAVKEKYPKEGVNNV
jgi:hypothetical protein